MSIVQLFKLVSRERMKEIIEDTMYNHFDRLKYLLEITEHIAQCPTGMLPIAEKEKI